MLCRVGRSTFLVVVRLVIELLRKHVVDSLLRHRVQRLKRITGGSIGREEAGVRLTETLSASPKTTPCVENEATRDNCQRVDGIKAAYKFRTKFQGLRPLFGLAELGVGRQPGADPSRSQKNTGLLGGLEKGWRGALESER
jgi:hypothetical protein